MPRRQPTATAAPRSRAGRRRRTATVLLSLTVVILLGPATPTVRAGAGWRLPVDDARVAGGFRVTPGAPFAAGQRRGIDVRSRPGAPVRAACSGRVTFAGPLPGRRGRRTTGVTVRCGGLVATHLGLAGIAVRRGRAVVVGARLGRVGTAGVVRLGARRAGDRHGYVDPLALLGAASGPAPLAPPPGPVVPRTRRRPPAPPRPAPLRAPAPRAAAPARTPPLAWVGLGLVAAGLPLTVTVARGRRRRAAGASAAARVAR